LGITVRYLRRNKLFSRDNEFSVGGDFQHQNGPIEFYDNLNGQKSDILTDLQNKKDENRGIFFQNNIDIFRKRIYLLFTGRYDWVVFDWKNRILAVQDARNSYEGFTPKLALNYKVNPFLSLYSSFTWSFRSPAGNELDNPPTPISSNPGGFINPDLKPQKSKNFELGMKGTVIKPDYHFFPKTQFEVSLFQYDIDQEIVPFEINGEYFFQNSARTLRRGLELGVGTNLIESLKLQIAYTFSDFIYDKYNASQYYYDNQLNLILEQQDYSDNVVPSVPRNNMSVSLKYEKSIFRGITGYSKLGYWRISGMFVDDANSDKTDGFQVFNFTVGIDATYRQFSMLISGGIQNLSDERYVGFININSASLRFYEAGAPRNYFTSIKLGLFF
jgi:iron complex outermembrane receptor protein